MKKRTKLFAFILALSLSCTAFAAEVEQPKPTVTPVTAISEKVQEEKAPIIIEGAMDVETQVMMDSLENPEHIKLGGWHYVKGTLNGYPVVVCRTQVGMVNAAASTALAIEYFKPAAIINQGTAGGHDLDVHKMDIILGKQSVNMGAFKSDALETGKGIEPTKWHSMTTEQMSILDDSTKEVTAFAGDENLIKAAKSVQNTYTKGNVVEGVIGSADEWNKENDRIAWLHETLNTSCEEMETAAAAQVAATYNVPFLGIRILSNHEVHGETYERTSGEDCQQYVLEVAKAYINDYLTKK